MKMKTILCIAAPALWILVIVVLATREKNDTETSNEPAEISQQPGGEDDEEGAEEVTWNPIIDREFVDLYLELGTPIFEEGSPVDAEVDSLQYIWKVDQFLANNLFSPHTKEIRTSINAKLGQAKDHLQKIRTLKQGQPGGWEMGTAGVSIVENILKERGESVTFGDVTDAASVLEKLHLLYKSWKADKEVKELYSSIEYIGREIKLLVSNHASATMADWDIGNYSTNFGTTLGLTVDTESMTIVRSIPMSPFPRYDLKLGDKILKIDGTPVDGKNFTSTLFDLLYENKSSFPIEYFRDGETRTASITPVQPVEKIVEVDFDSNWAGTFQQGDTLRIKNVFGKTLTNAVISVTIHNMDQTQSRNHIHVIPEWSSGDTHKTIYPLTDTFAYVRYVTVTVSADEFRSPTTHIYCYYGEEFDSDVARYCSTFKMSKQVLREGLISHAGVKISPVGIDRLPQCKVKLSYGGTPELEWTVHEPWLEDGIKFRHRQYNDAGSTECKLTLEFPFSSYRPAFEWE